MALTVGTAQPIMPTAFQGGGNKQTDTIMDFPVLASETYRPGDIVVLAAGLADAVNTAHADGAVLGVVLPRGLAYQSTDAAHRNQVMGATVTWLDKVLVACAMPGATFQGTLTAGAATDYTANAAAIPGAAVYDTVLGTDAYTGFLLVNSADTTGGQICVFRYATNQIDKVTGSPASFVIGGTAIVNPRVDFTFRSSAFQPVA